MSVYQTHEPLYIVTVRMDQAADLLQQWIRRARVSASQENNRMMIYDHYTLELFRMQWNHGWDMVVIWDCWRRRHIE